MNMAISPFNSVLVYFIYFEAVIFYSGNTNYGIFMWTDLFIIDISSLSLVMLLVSNTVLSDTRIITPFFCVYMVYLFYFFLTF